MNYWSALIEGKDKKPSIRVLLAIYFSLGVGYHVTYCTIYSQTMDGTVVGCLVAAVLGLLGIRSWQSVQENKLQAKNEI
jgi:hypothetical protein